jgi:ankyrin repeat protein
MKGDEEVVSVLLSAGADPNRRDNTGRTPLMAVFTDREHDSSRLGVLQLLLKVSDLSIKDDSEKTAYDYAKEFGSSTEIVLVGEALKSRSQSR